MPDETVHTCASCDTPLEQPGLPQYGTWWCPACKAHWTLSRQQLEELKPPPQEPA